jgi:uncharacterized protein (TIGR00661 family)
MNSKKNILVAPLNWGIGHATRCIPIILQLKKNNFNVIIMSSGRSLNLLNQEFPKEKFIKFEDYNVKYSSFLPMQINILLQIPKIIYGIYYEKRKISSIIKDYKIDGIISDNRYGLYSKEIPSVFITHQIKIQTPYLKELLKNINCYFIKKFSECWIPDNDNDRIAGELSSTHKTSIKHKYIGPLSRLQIQKKKDHLEILAIVSGPEPQRTIFEKILTKELKKTNKKSLLLQGKPEKNYSQEFNNLTIKSHLKTEELNQVMTDANTIICRAGYSTIMDLITLEKNATLVPTPGQTEQEYLAGFLSEKRRFKFQKQDEINLDLISSNIKEQCSKAFRKKNEWTKLFEIFNN